MTMADAATLQANIDALNAAIGRGARVVQVNGERVEYQSMAELIRARDDQKRQLDALTGAAVPGAVSVTYPRTSRGL